MFATVYFQIVSNYMFYVGENFMQILQVLTWRVVIEVLGWKGSHPNTVPLSRAKYHT